MSESVPLDLSRLSLPAAVSAVAALLGVAAVAVLVGPAGIDRVAAVGALLDALPLVEIDHGLDEVDLRVLFDIRMPRIALGALVGSILSVAGASYQGVFRNPLADPFLLGVAAGAGLGATSAFGMGLAGWAVALLAFVGGLVSVAATYVLGRSVGGRTTTSLILAGVAVAAFATAVQTYLLQRNVETLREVYAWILGRLSTVGWSEVAALAPFWILSLGVLMASRRQLDVLSIGDDEASALGVKVARVRWVVVIAATLATAAAVSVSGLIGFVGIIVPHTMRLLFGYSYRVIVPLSLLFGAAFLMGSDLAARSLAAPAELPIGVVTAFLGAPFFVLVLRSMRGA